MSLSLKERFKSFSAKIQRSKSMLELLYSQRRNWRKKINCGFKISGIFPKVPNILAMIVYYVILWLMKKLRTDFQIPNRLLKKVSFISHTYLPRNIASCFQKRTARTSREMWVFLLYIRKVKQNLLRNVPRQPILTLTISACDFPVGEIYS